jgi:DNA-binding transcriptional regulator YdaS (Cro superfamily)
VIKPEQLAALNLAIEKGGGIVKFASTLKVTLSAVQHWRKKGVPPKRVKPIEEATGVKREALRPDLYA